MTSGHDVSEYLVTFGLVKSYFFKFFEYFSSFLCWDESLFITSESTE
jgi:hypothetical protein